MRSVLSLSLSLFLLLLLFFFEGGGGGEVGGSAGKSYIRHGQSYKEEFNKANNIC